MPWCASATVPSTFQCPRTCRRIPHPSPDTPYRGGCRHSVMRRVLPGHLHIVQLIHSIALLRVLDTGILASLKPREKRLLLLTSNMQHKDSNARCELLRAFFRVARLSTTGRGIMLTVCIGM